ncbi:MAG TPA: FKBP-type peptidyl-prolyl cis-trans isomerase [Myxococcaceae bacterium]|nr:FKBP-type peptidyl-prolyl cis-trans isomerase [Myxococcaceae bacterium]
MLRILLACSFLALAAACGEDGNSSGDPAKTRFAPNLEIDLAAMQKSESGLYWQDLVLGSGVEAKANKQVGVRYIGWLPDGSIFDSSGSRSFVFVLGTGYVIKGWDEGVQGMKVGGRRLLVIPSDLAYGERGYPGVIPPNSVLVFEVELASAAE